MTECGPIAVNYPYTGVHAIGQLHCDAKAKIVDECGRRLGVGEIGEIFVKKLFSFVGYYTKIQRRRVIYLTKKASYARAIWGILMKMDMCILSNARLITRNTMKIPFCENWKEER